MLLLQEWNYLSWLVIGFILLILECMLPGIFLMWLGFGALILGMILFMFSDISLTAQLISFSVISAILCLIWWRYQENKRILETKQTNTLNQRDNYMLGTKGVVVEVFSKNIGRAKFGDTTWKVEGYNLEIGQTVTVHDTKDITLIVK